MSSSFDSVFKILSQRCLLLILVHISLSNGLVCLFESYIRLMNEDLTSPGSSFGTPPWLKSQNSPSIQIKIPMAFVKMGFGYDNSRNIYKVVSMVVKAQSRKTEVRFIA